jgi:hypothetical protein
MHELFVFCQSYNQSADLREVLGNVWWDVRYQVAGCQFKHAIPNVLVAHLKDLGVLRYMGICIRCPPELRTSSGTTSNQILDQLGVDWIQALLQ